MQAFVVLQVAPEAVILPVLDGDGVTWAYADAARRSKNSSFLIDLVMPGPCIDCESGPFTLCWARGMFCAH
jgi:hypothetical protein